MDLRTPAFAVIGLALLAVTSGCTSSEKSQPPDGGSASAAAAAAALADLQHQASTAESLSFTATYRAQGSDPPRSGNVTVFHTSSSTRIDVGSSDTKVRIVVTAKGTFSCKFSATAPLCVTLAGPGATIPPAVDPGLQHLFTSTLAEIRAGAGLRVEPAPAPSASTNAANTTSTRCYAITSVGTASEVTPGTYCFSAGLLVSAQFRTSSLTLTSIGAAPVATDFTLPAQPAPLTSPSAIVPSPTQS